MGAREAHGTEREMGSRERTTREREGGSAVQRARAASQARSVAAAKESAARARQVSAKEATRLAPLRHESWGKTKEIEDVGFWDEAKQRGMVEALLGHIPGLLPGVDVQARKYTNIPGQMAPSETSFSIARALGDMVGPGIGDMMQGGVELAFGEDVGEFDISDMTPSLSGLPSGTQKTRDARKARGGRDGGAPFASRTIDQTVAALQQEEAEKQQELAALLFGPGYTRAGQGVIAI